MTLEDRIEEEGVLPLRIIDDKDEHLVEVIICAGISGGARFKNNMPAELSLLRILEDGTEYRQRYKQVNE